MGKGQVAIIGVFILLVVFFLVCAVCYGISYAIVNSDVFASFNESSQEAFDKLDNNYTSLDYLGVVFVIVYIVINIIFTLASREHPILFLVNLVFFIGGIVGFVYVGDFIAGILEGGSMLSVYFLAFPIILNIVRYWPLISTATFFLSLGFKFISGGGYY